MIDSVDENAPPPDLQRSRRPRSAALAPGSNDRLPPHSPEAEQGVLGCILLSPHDAMGECIEKFKSGPEVFYDLRHQTIFSTIAEMYDSREAVDVITLQQRLKDKKLLDQVGGLAYLSSLPDAVPSAANLSYYADIVQEKYLLRKMLRTCLDVVARVYEHEGEVDSLMDEVERDVLRISESRVQQSSVTIKDLVKKAINTIQDFHERQGRLVGVGTGFTDLDRMTGGLKEGEMVRMLCSRSRVNMRNVRDGFLAERDFPKLTAAAGQLAKAPLFIDDSSGLSILQLRAKARRMHQQSDIKLFVIDYLQLLHSTARRAENRQQEIADISNGIKALAKELRVPVIVLSQLNRELEKDKNRKPRMSDLRESGSIEQDADLVGLLYKPSSGDDDDASGGGGSDDDAVAVNLLVAKQRNGPTGDVNLTFFKSLTRFESAAKVSDEDLPG
jgi:replicative DNA helicase